MPTAPVPATVTRFRFVFGDANYIYGVKDNGTLVRSAAEPFESLGRASEAEQIDDSGWGHFIFVVAGGAGVVYAVEPDGHLKWYRYDDAAGGWAANSGAVIDAGWDRYVNVFSDGDGSIYGIDPDGTLTRYRDEARDGSPLPDDQTTQVGTGWNQFSFVVAGGNGSMYAVRPDGVLLWYQDLGRDGGVAWHPNSGTQVGSEWDQFIHVFSGKAGDVYAVRCDNFGPKLVRYRDLVQDGTNATTPDSWVVARGDDASADPVFISGGGWQCIPVEGYAWPQSAAPGEVVNFFLSSVLPGECQVTFVRMRRKVLRYEPESLAGADRTVSLTYQLCPEDAWAKGCGWVPSLSLVVPADWESGYYVARCVSRTGFTYDLPFVVLAPAPGRGDFAVLANTDTWNAYNAWGGESNYTFVRDKCLSFLRPNHHLLTAYCDHPNGYHMLCGEVWVFDWMAEQGYRLDLYTDLDAHLGRLDFAGYKCVILSTHPEYWSIEMINALCQYLDTGGRILYLGGNGIYRPTAFRPLLTTSNTKMLTNSDDALASAFNARITNPTVLGVWTGQLLSGGGGYTIQKPEHRFINHAAAAGEEIGRTGGWNPVHRDAAHPLGLGAAYSWEVDEVAPPSVGREVDNLAYFNDAGHKTMAYYEEPVNHGWVLGMGSITFGGSLMVEPVLQAIIRNAMNECLA